MPPRLPQPCRRRVSRKPDGSKEPDALPTIPLVTPFERGLRWGTKAKLLRHRQEVSGRFARLRQAGADPPFAPSVVMARHRMSSMTPATVWIVSVARCHERGRRTRSFLALVLDVGPERDHEDASEKGEREREPLLAGDAIALVDRVGGEAAQRSREEVQEPVHAHKLAGPDLQASSGASRRVREGGRHSPGSC